MKTGTWLHRQIAKLKQPASMPDIGTAPAQNPLTRVTAIRENNYWRIVSPDFRSEGVRVYRMQLGLKTIDQILTNRAEFDVLQAAMDDAPKTYTVLRKPKEVVNGA